jgi:hypothetical protein
VASHKQHDWPSISPNLLPGRQSNSPHLTETASALLQVVIKRAVNCKAQDTSTVFVELRVGDSHANSEPVPATAEPTWNETKYLLVRWAEGNHHGVGCSAYRAAA